MWNTYQCLILATIQVDDQAVEYICQNHGGAYAPKENQNESKSIKTGQMSYKLEDLAYARSGDKGDSCNIGVIARNPKFLPYIKNQLTSEAVHSYFEHFIDSEHGKVTGFDVPSLVQFNFWHTLP